MRYAGQALIFGGGAKNATTQANKAAKRALHSAALNRAAAAVSASWQARMTQRKVNNLPELTPGIPVLLQVDPDLDLNELRERFGFEIVSEQEDGYVIVASDDVNLSELVQRINDFSGQIRGSAVVAKIHQLFEDPDQNERLKRILSDSLLLQWPSLPDDQVMIWDIGVECLGADEIPNLPNRGKRDTDSAWAQKMAEWSTARAEAYQRWDDLKIEREGEITGIVKSYNGEILSITESAAEVALPDSFSVRIRVIGKGLRDLVLNYPFIFEVVEPDEIQQPHHDQRSIDGPVPNVTPLPPPQNAPAICVIDSGIQEEHRLISAGIDGASSFCFLPGKANTEVGDFVRPGGHGTRVAGAILYGESIPESGEIGLNFWIQNARVLDHLQKLPPELFPPAVLQTIIERYSQGARATRIYNHSINADAPCRTRHMSAWAAAIDALSEQLDILVVQSAGNLHSSSPMPFCGVKEYLDSGRDYPSYLNDPSSRIANPAQSLQALTVGSVAYGKYEDANWISFASDAAHPSAFSRSGFGIWNVIKPEVVEFGGDNLRTTNSPIDVGTPSHARRCYPQLVRSTMFPPGPALDRDDVGTSYATPKVTRIAAMLQQTLPDETCLLYRALIAQSARWPSWTRNLNEDELLNTLRRIGYGIPDIQRATTNTEFRTTLVASRDPQNDRELRIKPNECHIFQVPIPSIMRNQADEFDILIEVTLSYVAQPRRTRRNLRRYLSTWADWKTSKLGESLDTFRLRALKDQIDADGSASKGKPIPWMLHTNPNWGSVRGAKRSAGTLQKDWAVVKSNALPEMFCVGVVGHEGWSNDPDSSAKYALTVSFEVIGQEISIYEEIRTAVEELRVEIQAEGSV